MTLAERGELQILAEPVGDLGFHADGHFTVGEAQAESLTFPKAAALGIGIQHRRENLARAAAAGGVFATAQQGGSGTGAAGRGEGDEEAGISGIGVRETEGKFHQCQQASPVTQAEALAGRRIDAGGGPG